MEGELIGLENLPEEFRIGVRDEFRLDLFRKAENEVGDSENLARELDISKTHLSELKRGLIFIRLKTLKILLLFAKMSLEEIEKFTVQIIAGRVPVNIKLPLMGTKELASLVGHVFGDGHIKTGGQQFNFVNKNIDLINEVKRNVKLIFGISVNEHFIKESGLFELFIPSTVAKLLIAVGAPEGKKSTQILHVPSWIKEGDQEIKSAFIRALFDDEAWVGIKQGGFFIGFAQNKNIDLLDFHRTFLEEIRKILLELNVNTTEIFQRLQKGNSIQLGFKIIGLQNLSHFNSKIGFLSRDKQERLEFVIKNFKQIQFGKKEAKLKILEKLNVPMKSKELATILNRDQKTIWKHLHQLHKKNLVVKIGTKNKVFWKLNSLNNINIKDN